MDKKSFIIGFLLGVVLTFTTIIVIGLVNQRDETDDPIEYLEKPVSYENKEETSFKVFQVLGDAALASEISDETLGLFLGKTVLILGENFYSKQIVTFKKPLRVGTYNYTNKGGTPMTVPVIEGDIIE